MQEKLEKGLFSFSWLFLVIKERLFIIYSTRFQIFMWVFQFLEERFLDWVNFTFDIFLDVLSRNQVNSLCSSAQTAHKPVKTSSAIQTTGTKQDLTVLI